MLEQVSRALEVMVVLVTACGMLLLLAQVQVGMRQRHRGAGGVAHTRCGEKTAAYHVVV